LRLSETSKVRGDIISIIMKSAEQPLIPDRAETLKVLWLMGDYAPILMLSDDDDGGFGARWSIDGHPVHPAIARFLTQSSFIAVSGTTELGAKKLALTEAGAQFRKAGMLWWSGLTLLEKLKIMVVG
jgi:hypothetical protein